MGGYSEHPWRRKTECTTFNTMGYTATARHTNNYSRHEVFLLLDAKLRSPCLTNDSGSLQGPQGTAQQVASNSFCVLHYGSYSPILLNSF